MRRLAGVKRKNRAGTRPAIPSSEESPLHRDGGSVKAERSEPEGSLDRVARCATHISDDGAKKLLARVRRIRGQIEGIERAIHESNDCYAVLQQTDAARGVLGGRDGRRDEHDAPTSTTKWSSSTGQLMASATSKTADFE